MPLLEHELRGNDVDWFGVDHENHIGHFTTGGFGPIPRQALESFNSVAEFRVVLRYFEDMPATCQALESQNWRSKSHDRLDMSNERAVRLYLSDYVAMASKGIYSYDADVNARGPVPYFRIAMPVNPLNVGSLPPEISLQLKKISLPNVAFADRLEIVAADLGDVVVLGI